MFISKRQNLYPRSSHGFLLVEFMCGLVLIVLLLGLLVTTLGKVREADIIMANRRQAIYFAQSQLATMQIPNGKLADDIVTVVEVLPDKPKDKRYAWVRLTVTHDGQQASLVGLVCREQVGDLP